MLSTSLYNAQYSQYYNSALTANVNVAVTGSSFEYKTITTIDYGALQLANAQKEQNRLELQKFTDERQRIISLEIAENPVKAFDYGQWLTLSTKDKAWSKTKENRADLKKLTQHIGFSNFKIEYVVPYILFTQLDGYNLQNVSEDGVTTDIIIRLPFYNIESVDYDIEKNFEQIPIGKEVDYPDDQGKIRKVMVHKKDLNRTTVFGNKGFRTTMVLEDKYEKYITDNYEFYGNTIGNGFILAVKVTYYGNHNDVDFEKLEGRRYYLKPLIDKIISTVRVSDLTILK